ncbi:MAG TPA: hypothetical protein VFM73_03485 [Xanthomonadaceae bacterium]|nr:hypothetical protein [Xanthomonadaceae bacterium]
MSMSNERFLKLATRRRKTRDTDGRVVVPARQHFSSQDHAHLLALPAVEDFGLEFQPHAIRLEAIGHLEINESIRRSPGVDDGVRAELFPRPVRPHLLVGVCLDTPFANTPRDPKMPSSADNLYSSRLRDCRSSCQASLTKEERNSASSPVA